MDVEWEHGQELYREVMASDEDGRSTAMSVLRQRQVAMMRLATRESSGRRMLTSG